MRSVRRMKKFWSLLGILLVCFCGGVEGAADPQIEALLQQISQDSLETTVRRMVAFETRFMGSDSNAAATVWLKDRMEGLGYEVRFDTFSVNVVRRVQGQQFIIRGLQQWNVIATRPGRLFPDKKIVVGGHYDSISLDRAPDAQDVAPGADDDASGVAGLVEIGRILRDVHLDVTVEIVFFGAEELGLIGSTHYADAARARGDEILLMFQLDVIGNRSSSFPNGFTIDTSSAYVTEGELLAQAAVDYTAVRAFHSGISGVQVTNRGCGCSDHQSFIDRGYPALGVFQYFQNPASHINMSFDTLDKVDYALVAEITKATLAAGIQVAGFPSISPDFDGDGLVAFSDFLLFSGAFRLSEGMVEFDLDRDGSVGFSDFLIFAANFGRRFE